MTIDYQFPPFERFAQKDSSCRLDRSLQPVQVIDLSDLNEIDTLISRSLRAKRLAILWLRMRLRFYQILLFIKGYPRLRPHQRKLFDALLKSDNYVQAPPPGAGKAGYINTHLKEKS